MYQVMLLVNQGQMISSGSGFFFCLLLVGIGLVVGCFFFFQTKFIKVSMLPQISFSIPAILFFLNYLYLLHYRDNRLTFFHCI